MQPRRAGDLLGDLPGVPPAPVPGAFAGAPLPASTAALLALLALLSGEARAQTAPQPPPVPAAPAAQDPPPSLAELKRQLDELAGRNAEELEDLRFEVQSLEKELADARARATPQAPAPNVFNPRITVFGNILASADDVDVFAEDDPAGERIDNRLNLRETELDLRAAIDPWADGVVILSLESPSPNEFEAGVEEGYVTLKRLPFVEAAPGGLQLQVGRFRQGFGRFNKIHLHDLPQPSYPRALTNLLGLEGYVQNGAAGQFFLPSPSERSTLQATLALLDGGNVPLDPVDDGHDLASLAHVGWFAELGDASTLELGVSGWRQDDDRALLGLDATWEHKPLSSGEWFSFLAGGELFAAVLDDPALDDRPQGWYLWSQLQLSRNAYVGARFDRAEELADASQRTDTVGAYLTYYTSEFLRFRLGYEHAESDVARLDGRDTVLLEINFVFGSHPVEPYWVNR